MSRAELPPTSGQRGSASRPLSAQPQRPPGPAGRHPNTELTVILPRWGGSAPPRGGCGRAGRGRCCPGRRLGDPARVRLRSRTRPGPEAPPEGAEITAFLLGEQALMGTRMLRMPNCLLKLTRVVLGHKLRALFILAFKFMSFVSIVLYWRITQDSKGRDQTYLPVQIHCAHSVPSPPCAVADGPSPPPGDVFFVETSERTNPNYLFMCSVESAARTHPGTRVVVLMKGLANRNASLPNHWGFSLLSCFPNVEIRPLDLPELFSGTPLAQWYLQAQQRWEPYFLPILSDACRIAIMWKFGGIYLDTDFIVLKNLKNLTNVLGTQSKYVLNGAFLSFTPKHKFIELCMQDFVENYNSWIWGHQGPQLLTRVFKKWCSIRSLRSSKSCKGVSALPREAFYPIRWQDWKKYFEVVSSTELNELLKNTYAVHVWNKKSQGTRLEITSQALLAQLHSLFCPATYDVLKMDFKWH